MVHSVSYGFQVRYFQFGLSAAMLTSQLPRLQQVLACVKNAPRRAPKGNLSELQCSDRKVKAIDDNLAKLARIITKYGGSVCTKLRLEEFKIRFIQ